MLSFQDTPLIGTLNTALCGSYRTLIEPRPISRKASQAAPTHAARASSWET